MKDNCFSSADILLPKNDFESWAVIACDQYTSEPEYWHDVERSVGDKPSALNLVLPEVYLKPDNTERINLINDNMMDYLEKGIFNKYEDSMFYVERLQSNGIVRHGVIGKINLECYDYKKGSDALIRATEETVVSRIPPRVEIRKDAPLELPHIMLIIDDREQTVIEPLTEKKETFKKLYDFTLMKNSGKIEGYKLDKNAQDEVLKALQKLEAKNNGLLFCVGDGNHSLATAKECYNLNKNEASKYALVEFVNLLDDALQFEPIYRVVFGADKEDLIKGFTDYCGGEYNGDDAQRFTLILGEEKRELSVKPKSKLSVGTLQTFLDEYVKKHTQVEIDYIHGIDSVEKICKRENALGFIFEGMKKEELFDAVRLDGSLPRKTFSMGHAADKRFYIEARKIK